MSAPVYRRHNILVMPHSGQILSLELPHGTYLDTIQQYEHLYRCQVLIFANANIPELETVQPLPLTGRLA